MGKSSQVEAHESHPTAGESARVAELQRRIEELEAPDEDRFGRFGAGDWIACIIASLVVPAIVVLWFAR